MTRLQARRRNDLLLALVRGPNWAGALARQLEVNPATVGSLLAELEAEGLLYSAQGRGLTPSAKRRYFGLTPEGAALAQRVANRRRSGDDRRQTA